MSKATHIGHRGGHYRHSMTGSKVYSGTKQKVTNSILFILQHLPHTTEKHQSEAAPFTGNKEEKLFVNKANQFEAKSPTPWSAYACKKCSNHVIPHWNPSGGLIAVKVMEPTSGKAFESQDYSPKLVKDCLCHECGSGNLWVKVQGK
jgi:hypothetical protein